MSFRHIPHLSGIPSTRSLVLAAIVGVALMVTPSPAAEREDGKGLTNVSIEIPAGQWKTVRLKNLPREVVVALAVQTDGMINVGFLTSTDRHRFPAMGQPLFWGQTEKKLGFSVTIQEQGDYYVLFDNREGDRARHIALTARARVGGSAAQALMAERLRKVEQQLKVMEQQLSRTFLFNPVTIHVAACDRPQPFRRADGLTLCLEYARELLTSFQDKTQASDALVYSMFYEMAQLFRSQWTAPLPDPPGPPDEFTTVLMLMFRLDAQVRSYAQMVINQPGISETLVGTFHDPAHPLTTERAEQVLKWATDPSLVKRWQPFLVSHMQTAMLRRLHDHPQPWSDATLIQSELAQREASPSPTNQPPPKTLTF